ncbi:hypothetical protein Trydic_g9927 [Trypoxylus dichotomus]
MERLQGKLAIVAGAGSYVGMAIVEKLTRAGVRVLGLDTEVKMLDDLAVSLAQSGGIFQYFITDLSDEVNITNAIDWAKTNIGPIHVLINNLRLRTTPSPIRWSKRSPAAVFSKDISGFNTITRQVLRNMTENGIDGHIIHISALLGNGTSKNVFKYVKDCVDLLTECLRCDIRVSRSKIKVTNLCPGIPKPALESQCNSELMSSLRCKDVVDAVGYILSTPSHVQIRELSLSAI